MYNDFIGLIFIEISQCSTVDIPLVQTSWLVKIHFESSGGLARRLSANKGRLAPAWSFQASNNLQNGLTPIEHKTFTFFLS